MVGTLAPATIRIKRPRPFDVQWEVESQPLDPRAPINDLLRTTPLTCRKGEAPHPVESCLSCRRFLGWSLEPGSDRFQVSCHWDEHDPVSARMTEASALVTVEPGLACEQADALAKRSGVRHLLVMQDGKLLGVVCRCDLFGTAAGKTLAQVINPDILAIDSRAGIGEAALAMSTFGVGLLPVVANDLLVGVISRGDLRRAGVPESRLGARRCQVCDSVHGVRPDPWLGTMDYCLDCLARGSQGT